MLELDATPLEALRRRSSAKWRVYPEDVLPAWVAEMDFPLAAPIVRALREAVEQGDAGYAFPAGLGEAFAGWAERRWGWAVSPQDVRLVTDVVTAIAEIVRAGTSPGDGVVIEPPVYPPFAATIRTTGRSVIEAPMERDAAGGWAPDLSAIARAYEAGARAHLLCSPHNPTGVVYSPEALREIARLARRHEVLVVSDEIHAPLTLPGATHHPFPTVSEEAARVSVVLTSASKAWNVAGLKAAMMIASAERPRAVLAQLPPDLPYHAGLLGVIAARTAFREGIHGSTRSSRYSIATAGIWRSFLPGPCRRCATCPPPRATSRGSTARRSGWATIPREPSWIGEGWRCRRVPRSARRGGGSRGSTSPRPALCWRRPYGG